MFQKVNVSSVIYWNSNPISISFKKFKNCIYKNLYRDMNMKTY